MQLLASVRSVQSYLTHVSLHCPSFCSNRPESWTTCNCCCVFIFSHSAVIDTAMKYIVAERPSGGLTYQDHFFREVRSVLHCFVSSTTLMYWICKVAFVCSGYQSSPDHSSIIKEIRRFGTQWQTATGSSTDDSRSKRSYSGLYTYHSLLKCVTCVQCVLHIITELCTDLYEAFRKEFCLVITKNFKVNKIILNQHEFGIT